MEPKVGENFSAVAIQCWVPPGKEQLRGILCVILHPHAHGGMLIREPEAWKQLAFESGFAFVAVSIVESGDATRPWFKADQGTGRALISGFDKLSVATSHPEMTELPIVIAGVCAAGQFAYEFASFEPKRTAAFVTIGGGKHDTSKAVSASRVSGLVVLCDDRGDNALRNMLALYLEGLKNKARWALAMESISLYDKGTSSLLVSAFLEDTLRRIAAGKSSNDAAVVSSMSERLDEWKSKHPAIAPELNLSANATSWFPSHRVADIWKKEIEEIPLSFPGISISPTITTSQRTVDLGTIQRNEHGIATANIAVSIASFRKDVDGIELASYLPSELKARREGENGWRIEGTIDLQFAPFGDICHGCSHQSDR